MGKQFFECPDPHVAPAGEAFEVEVVRGVGEFIQYQEGQDIKYWVGAVQNAGGIGGRVAEGCSEMLARGFRADDHGLQGVGGEFLGVRLF